MAANAKRKQEEKHLKMLREMTSLPPNRKCFDCDQRGPTYANMTVGSFVCTSCSGILRGLNPPHRVKSISMTTFTQQEIEFLQKHGNEVCKQIWLGLYDDRTSAVPDFREPQKVKEFLQEKYEKKRWFVPPDQAKVVASVHASISGSSASSTSSTPEVRPLKSLLGDSAPTLHLNKTTPSQSPVVGRTQQQQMGQQFQEKKFDLLTDLGGDIFAAPPTQTAASANFANFAHFNSHPGTGILSGASSAPASAGVVSTQSQPAGHGGDRYAALAELDNVFSSSAPTSSVYSTSSSTTGVFGTVAGATPAQVQQVIPSMPQGFGVAPSTNPFVAAAVAPATAPTNPFQTNGRAAAVAAAASFGTGSMSMPAGFGNATAYNLPTSFSGTFQQPFPGQAPFPQPSAYPQQPNGAGFPAFGQAKPVGTPFGQAMSGPGVSSNPFLAGASAGQFPTGGSSTNPFL
ncbi:arf-GAP domain and FG repeat-containing protein 1a isoform X5 [Scleropages formosus]|uniref:arf-GAP domain and FG repeat-containing protein 1a isoform X5 n=1 Tax=Scleropages formosus TaxID=113540 RepID=UPI000878D9CE|nr:arf-GAP domain and FG repeat-containing protein 1 isoform X5 [Scleropages formosus]